MKKQLFAFVAIMLFSVIAIANSPGYKVSKQEKANVCQSYSQDLIVNDVATLDLEPSVVFVESELVFFYNFNVLNVTIAKEASCNSPPFERNN